MEISKAEYKLLKKIFRNKKMAINNEISDVLLSKGLVKSDFVCMTIDSVSDDCVSNDSDELQLTNDGIIAYENYHNKKLSVRRACIQSWIAIGISASSLAVSLISLLRG